MNPTYRRIFDAMPVGRPVLARELYRRCCQSLPGGWCVGSVAAAVRWMVGAGLVSERVSGDPKLNEYTRTDRRPS